MLPSTSINVQCQQLVRLYLLVDIGEHEFIKTTISGKLYLYLDFSQKYII